MVTSTDMSLALEGAHAVAGRTDTSHENRMGCVVSLDDHPEF